MTDAILDEEVTAKDDGEEEERLNPCEEKSLDVVVPPRLNNTATIAGKVTELRTRKVTFATVDFAFLATRECPSTAECRIPILNP